MFVCVSARLRLFGYVCLLVILRVCLCNFVWLCCLNVILCGCCLTAVIMSILFATGFERVCVGAVCCCLCLAIRCCLVLCVCLPLC